MVAEMGGMAERQIAEAVQALAKRGHAPRSARRLARCGDRYVAARGRGALRS
jgi:hypothetical protein